MIFGSVHILVTMRPNLRNFHTVLWKLRNFTATFFSQNFRQIDDLQKKFYCKLIWRKNFCMAVNCFSTLCRNVELTQKMLTTHSVEKYTKTLSRAKIIRQTTHQNYAKSTFTNAWCFTLRRHFWVKWTKSILKSGTYAWIYSKEHFFFN